MARARRARIAAPSSGPDDGPARGGVRRWAETGTALNIEGGALEYCAAGFNGGAIAFQGTELNVTGTKFKSNDVSGVWFLLPRAVLEMLSRSSEFSFVCHFCCLLLMKSEKEKNKN